MLIVDAHVHIYPLFDTATLFDSAMGNFKKWAKLSGCENSFTAILLLSERVSESWFETVFELISRRGKISTGKWMISGSGDNSSLRVENRDNEVIYVIAGRQFVCSEGLEVLSLVSRYTTQTIVPCKNLIHAIHQHNGVPVIPWAFGKWYGKRGRHLQEILTQREDHRFFLGDNGGRAVCMPSIILRRNNREGEYPILSGSDPLPVKGEEKRVGSYGFYCHKAIEEHTVSESLRSVIQDPHADIQPYGDTLPFSVFIRNQILLRKKPWRDSE